MKGNDTMTGTHNTTAMSLICKAKLEKESKIITVKGKLAKTLKALIEAKQKGVTSLELSNTWAFRTSAYIHDLRHDYGLDIEMIREPHQDGWHGRYILRTSVEILESGEA